MNLEEVAREIAVRLAPLFNGRATPYARDNLVPPAAYVFGPDMTYHQTYKNGMSMVTLSVTAAVARLPQEQAFKQINAFISDSGDKSVKTVLEADESSYESLDSITVTGAQVTDAQIAGLDCKCAVFELEIVGSGS